MSLSFSRDRRDFLKNSGKGLALASLAPYISSAETFKGKGSKRPNVLFLMTDQHSPHVVGCYGNSLVKTPHLDQLANQGQQFNSTYCQNAICVPSRASIVTGRMPSAVDVFGNAAHTDLILNGEPITYANVFKREGYDAQWLGKEHWAANNAGLGFGNLNEAVDADIKASKEFKQLRAEVGRLPQSAQTYNFSEDWDEDAIVAEHAIRYLDQAGENPFFLGVSMRKPHFPFLVHEDYYAPYEDTVDMPTVTQAMLDNLPKQNRKHREKYGFAEMTDAQTKKARAVYYGMVQFIDSQIGRILKKLDEKGLRENTIIVYLSDHGEMAGEHGLWYKNAFYQASAAVPMIISHPKTLDVGKQVDANVMLTDLFPTMCDMCGIDRPDELQGRSLVPLMKQKVTTNKRPAICETYSDPRNPGRMIRRGDWKYNWFTDGKKQLFNIAKDPGETTDLIGEKQHADLVAKLHDLSMETFIPTPDSVFDQIKKEKEQQQKQAA